MRQALRWRAWAGASLAVISLAMGASRAQERADAAPPFEVLRPSQGEAAATPQTEAPAAPAVADVQIAPPDLPPVTVIVEGTPPEPTIVVDLPPVLDAAGIRAIEQQAFADALRDRLAAPLPRSVARLGKRERDAMAAFYAARENKPLWIENGQVTPAATAVANLVAHADEDGLQPEAYALPSLTLASPNARIEAEIALTAAALAYARDARGGRIEPSRLSSLITPDLELPDPAALLPALAASNDPAGFLAGFQPQHPGYKALKAKLREMREATGSVAAPRSRILEGRTLRIGDVDPRVPLLRARLDMAQLGDTLYDEDLARAVRSFQRKNNLRPTGVFDTATADVLDGAVLRAPRSIPAADIIVNMERWRWLPADLGERHILVNLPEFTLRLVDHGRVVHRTRVIVGKPETPTPIFSHPMEYVIVNPSWNIPPSILRKEILPGLAADPDYAAKRGYQIIRRGNSISVRQPPGERNALGFIKFMFPNRHAVYLHDTPSRNLFSNERRAFSHGCVRVDQPFRLAEFVLGEQGYDEHRMRGMIGTGERTIRLKQQLPVHLTYFTLFVDEDGRLQRRDDLYGHDGKVRTALGIGADGHRYAQVRQ
jgi:murein L,D-transpeptidase YcbB/YkuD